MRPEQGFAGRTRVVKVKGHGKGRRGLIKETNLISGSWMVLFDDTLLVEKANPYEFDYDKAIQRSPRDHEETHHLVSPLYFFKYHSPFFEFFEPSVEFADISNKYAPLEKDEAFLLSIYV